VSRAARLVASVAAALFGLCFASPSGAQGWGAPQPQQPPPPQQPAQPSPYGGMQAGGLAPPAPMGATPQPSATAQTPPPGETPTTKELEEAKAKDSGRGIEWVYLNVEGGFEQVGLQTFNVDAQNFSAGFFPTSASGGVVGAGLGLRLLFLTLGGRGRLGFFNAWNLFSAGGELGIHIPLGNFEPHIDLGGGYVGLGKVTTNLTDTTVNVRGYYARVGGGLDYYITPVFSVGAAASWEFMGLTRPGVSLDQVNKIKGSLSASDPQQAKADALALDGTSYGSALAITGVLGLHF
jgi:hypothetical protein